MGIRDRLFWEEEARKLGWKTDRKGRLIEKPVSKKSSAEKEEKCASV